MHAAVLAIGGTGVTWGWQRYVWEAGPEPLDPELLMQWTGIHPLEPQVRTLHLLAAPAAIFAIGLIWVAHVAPRWRRPWERRRTGLSLVLLFVPMVLSGILLQTATSPSTRTLMVWTHALTGGLWFLGYGAHVVAGRFRRKDAVDV